MKCAIQLVFDEESQEKINNIRKILIETSRENEIMEKNNGIFVRDDGGSCCSRSG